MAAHMMRKKVSPLVEGKFIKRQQVSHFSMIGKGSLFETRTGGPRACHVKPGVESEVKFSHKLPILVHGTS